MEKMLLRSAEPLRGSQIIFGLEPTVEKGKGCVCVRERKQKGREGRGGEEGAHRETGEDKKDEWVVGST